MLRDLALFAHSMIHSSVLIPSRNYWDRTRVQELGHVIKLLSQADDPERLEIRRILQQLQPERVLDAGCGPGTELEGYKRAGLTISYTGLDGSERMLARARQRHPGAHFIQGRLESLPFADRSFDAVLLKHVLEHQADYRPVLREAVRVSDRAVLVNLFHRLLPVPFNVRIKDRRGFWNNWYARGRFERFLRTLPIEGFERVRTVGTARQTAEIYVLRR